MTEERDSVLRFPIRLCAMTSSVAGSSTEKVWPLLPVPNMRTCTSISLRGSRRLPIAL